MPQDLVQQTTKHETTMQYACNAKQELNTEFKSILPCLSLSQAYSWWVSPVYRATHESFWLQPNQTHHYLVRVRQAPNAYDKLSMMQEHKAYKQQSES